MPSNDLGTITIDGRFKIRGFFVTGFKFFWMGIKELLKLRIKLKKDTADLMYAISVELDVRQMNKR